MADLILKPVSTNNLILQDEGANAALTVSTAGNVTLAGTANDLGTISTATVFPSGRIVGTYLVENSTKSTTAGVSTAFTKTWGTFTKKQAATTKLVYCGNVMGHTQYDNDAVGYFISFESSSQSQTKYRGVGSYDMSALGPGGSFLSFIGQTVAFAHAETYTVKWGSDTASNRFNIWNPDASTDARYGGARVSSLIIWEVVV